MTDAEDRIERGHPDGYFILGDALRGIACLVVVVNHAALGVVGHRASQLASAGTLGTHFSPAHSLGAYSFIGLRIGSPLIYMFFGLSGYLVGGPWVRAFLGDRKRPNVRRYLSRRARRILPAFWLIIVVRLLYKGTYGFSTGHVIGTFAGLQTFFGGQHQALLSQGWTVNVEIFFYLLIPLMAVGVAGLLVQRLPSGREERRRLVVALLLVWSVGGFLLRCKVAPDGWIGHSVLSLGWSFTPGLLLAAYEPEAKRWLPLHGRLGRRVSIALILAAVAADALAIALQINDGTVLAEFLHVVCGTGLLVGSMLWQWTTGGAPRSLDNRSVHAVGRWSYGVYLVHLTIGQYLIEHIPSGLGRYETAAWLTGTLLVLSVAAAGVLWHFWEEPWMEKRLPTFSLRRAPAT